MLPLEDVGPAASHKGVPSEHLPVVRIFLIHVDSRSAHVRSCHAKAEQGWGHSHPPPPRKCFSKCLLQLSRTPCRNLNSSTRDIHMCMRVCGHTQKDVHTCIRAHMAGCQNKGSWLPEKGWRYQGLIGQNQGSPTKTFYIDNYADTYILVGTRMPYMYIWLYVCNLILYLDVYILYIDGRTGRQADGQTN